MGSYIAICNRGKHIIDNYFFARFIFRSILSAANLTLFVYKEKLISDGMFLSYLIYSMAFLLLSIGNVCFTKERIFRQK